MSKIKVYLDNCCFNRPYDNQNDVKIKLETEAKLVIQEMILSGKLVLCWSYILDFENINNPFKERQIEIDKWSYKAECYTEEKQEILNLMKEIVSKGIKPLDALHISCSIDMNCDYFITVDRGILKKYNKIKHISIKSPIDFIYILEDYNNE
jgi:hypothetical protein